MKHILLIGGAGYVGTALSSHFLTAGYKVTILDNFIYNNQFAVQHFLGDPDYKLVYGDMGCAKSLLKASRDITDVVLLAGLVGDPITKKYPDESGKINMQGIQNTIDFFDGKGINKLIFISTCSNYGLIKEDELADENFQLSPLSLYAKAKVTNEEYLLEKKGKVDYIGVILRFATAFGLSSRMRFDLTISEFTRDLFFGEELLVYDEHTWRPYCHLRDFARLLEMVIHADNKSVYFEVFNAGGDINNYTKKMIVDEILKNLPDAKVRYGKHGSDPRNYKVSFNKVKNELGFEPHFTIEHGVKELVNALRIGVYADSINNKDKYGNYTIAISR